MKWLGENPLILYLLALLLVASILAVGLWVLRMLGAAVSDGTPLDELEVTDIEEFNVRYRCVVCATEIRLTRLAADSFDEDFVPPRHCREEMSMVVEAEFP